MDRSIVTITPTPPYDFDLRAAYATYFRGHYVAENFLEGVFRRLLNCRGHLSLVGFSLRGHGKFPATAGGDRVSRYQPGRQLGIQGQALGGVDTRDG